MQFLSKIKEGKPVYGTCITSFNPLWPKVWRGTGLDFVFLDTEHIALDRVQVSHICQQLLGDGIFPIVRIPSPDPFRACQMIDAGAKGIVAPYLESESQIRQLVGAVKYRPLKGEKLEELLEEKGKLPDFLSEYIQSHNKGNFCIANIESVPAMERLDKLLSVEGLDAVFIGPHDLSISMGIPEKYDHPDFEQAVKEILRTCKNRGLAVGIHFSESPERQVKWMKEGVNMVIHSSDFALFYQRLQSDMKRIRTSQGESLSDETGPDAI
ncbi:HpcH/HpaI aldolase family protein [Pleomorphovibrio marinus]|uniref:HpcH/HpaI aldolase family protein n=1 Tax=Pleomorphovibrio marinus TaxID=2164132 RepID=UPI000E0B5C63|nr:aldolase/citrate lyase family protein [Pleomorphovibrio marinus]